MTKALKYDVLSPCSCGGTNVEPYHKMKDSANETFSIWIQCKDCDATSEHSHQTYLSAVAEWNKTHKK